MSANTTTRTPTTDWGQLLTDHLAGRAGSESDLLRAASPIAVRAVRAVLDGPDVDDAVQETLFDVLRRVHTVRDPRALPGWIHVVGMNAGRRVRRQRARWAPPVDTATLGRLTPAADLDTDAIEARLDTIGLLDALDALSAREREVVLLLDVADGVSYGDVSRSLGCPVGSLGPTRQRALSKLRRDGRVLAAAAV